MGLLAMWAGGGLWVDLWPRCDQGTWCAMRMVGLGYDVLSALQSAGHR